MSQEWKLVPVEPTEEMNKAGMRWLTGIQHMRVGDKRNALNEAFKAMLAAAPVPPAGGEVEVLGYLIEGEVYQKDFPHWAADYVIGQLVDRAHVTRLQAENNLLRHDVASFLETMVNTCEMLGVDLESAKSVDGKPSDVLFEHAQRLTVERDALKADLASANADKEAYAQNAIDLRKQVDALKAACAGNFKQAGENEAERDKVNAHRADLIAERDALKAEVERSDSALTAYADEVANLHDENLHLQSELTKARELLPEMRRQFERANFVRLGKLINEAIAHQSAPAAKCQSCNGKGSVCIDWDAGEWMDCPQCKEPADARGYPDDAPGTTYDDASAAKGEGNE